MGMEGFLEETQIENSRPMERGNEGGSVPYLEGSHQEGRIPQLEGSLFHLEGSLPLKEATSLRRKPGLKEAGLKEVP